MPLIYLKLSSFPQVQSAAMYHDLAAFAKYRLLCITRDMPYNQPMVFPYVHSWAD